jgi:hypothetical protein
MLTVRWVAFAAMLVGFYAGLGALFSVDGLLYVGQQWSWLGAFFLAILVSLSVAWMMAWNLGKIVVDYRQGRSRLKLSEVMVSTRASGYHSNP